MSLDPRTKADPRHTGCGSVHAKTRQRRPIKTRHSNTLCCPWGEFIPGTDTQPTVVHESLRAVQLRQPRLQYRTSSGAVAQPLPSSQPAAGHASTAIWNCPASSSSSSSSSRHGLRHLVAEINSPVFILMKRFPTMFSLPGL